MTSLVLLLAPLLAGTQEEIRALVEGLGAETIQERESAELSLRKRGGEAIAELEKALLSNDTELVARAREALRWIRIKERLHPALLAAQPNVVDRLYEEAHAWAKAFLEASDPVAFPTLLRADLEVLAPRALMGARGKEEKIKVIQAVERWKLRSGTEGILALLWDPEGDVRSSAVRCVRRLEIREAIPDLLRLAREEHWVVASDSARTLGEMRVKEAIPVLRSLLKERFNFHAILIKDNAVQSLAKLGAKEASADIRAVMIDPNETMQVRMSAADALADFGVKEAVPALMAFLQDDRETYFRGSAAYALAQLGARQAIPILRRQLHDKRQWPREAAVSALGRLKAKEAIDDLMNLSRNRFSVDFGDIAEAVRSIDPEEARLRFRPLLEHPYSDTRRRAARALMEMGDAASVPMIRRLLKDKEDWTRRTAVDAMVQFGVRDSIPDLLGLLGDEDSSVRRAAMRALVHLGAPESIQTMRALLKDEVHGVRRTASELLCELGSYDGVPALIKDHHDKGWRMDSLNALRRNGAWKKLKDRRMVEDLAGNRLEVLEQLCQKAGLRIELETPTRRDEESWTLKRVRLSSKKGRRSLLDALNLIVSGKPYDYVLEKGHVRIVPRRQATEFWNAWWREQK